MNTIIEKIKAEIERRKKSLRAGICNEEVFTRRQRTEMLVASEELDRLNRFLSTLESEKPMYQDGLEEEIEQRWDELQTNFREINEAFEAGKREQREQMMREAVECETVCIKDQLLAVLPMKEFRWTVGDKVRIIIVKE